MAVVHSEPRSSTVLVPKLTTDLAGAVDTELIVTTSWNGPFIFGLVAILWDAAPAVVVTKVELLPAGVAANAILLDSDDGVSVSTTVLLGRKAGFQGILFAEGDQLRVTVPAGGAGRDAKVWIYSGQTGS